MAITEKGYQAIWQAIQEVTQGGKLLFTIPDLSAITPIRKRSIDEHLQIFAKNRKVKRLGKLPNHPHKGMVIWKLTAPSAKAPHLDQNGTPIEESAQAVIWRSLRMLNNCTVDKLFSLINIGRKKKIPRTTMMRYLRDLKTGEYLNCPDKNIQLIKNTGGDPPEIRSDGMLFDPNNNDMIAVRTKGKANELA